MTAASDSLIIRLGIVVYDPANLTGIHIGLAPIEDFRYSILAACSLLAIWQITGKWRKQESGDA